MNYSLKKGITKGAVAILAFGIPSVVLAFPDWANLTIGGLLIMVLNYLKVKTN
jgi:hypothetical protein